MRFATIKLLGLIGLQVVSALPATTSTAPSRIAKRAPGIDEELYLAEEIDVGSQIGKGTDGTVYKAKVKDVDGREDWNHNQVYALKKEYPDPKNAAKEFAAYKAIEGQGIGPKFAALVYESYDEPTQEVGIMIEYMEAKETDKNSKSQAKGAMDALKKLHNLGWMHGDLHSLSNVLVRKSDDKAFLIDFAKAKKTTDSRDKKEDIDALKSSFSGVEWDGDEPKN